MVAGSRMPNLQSNQASAGSPIDQPSQQNSSRNHGRRGEGAEMPAGIRALCRDSTQTRGAQQSAFMLADAFAAIAAPACGAAARSFASFVIPAVLN